MPLTKPTTLRLEPPDLQRVRQLARERGTVEAVELRRAIRAGLDQIERRTTDHPTDRGTELVLA